MIIVSLIYEIEGYFFRELCVEVGVIGAKDILIFDISVNKLFFQVSRSLPSLC